MTFICFYEAKKEKRFQPKTFNIPDPLTYDAIEAVEFVGTYRIY